MVFPRSIIPEADTATTNGVSAPQLNSATSQVNSNENTHSDGLKHLPSEESAVQSSAVLNNHVADNSSSEPVQPVQPAPKKLGRFSVDVVKETVAISG